MSTFDRRRFLQTSAGLAAGLLPAAASRNPCLAETGRADRSKMRFGLVTYQWGADWDLPTLLANCEKACAMGVELRTTHKHGVEPSLNAGQRRDVKARFADCPVTLVGLGSTQDFHSPEPDKVAA